MPGAPFTGYLTIAFLAVVLVMILVDSPLTMVVTAIAVALMVAGWYACRGRIRQIASTRDGSTGDIPLVTSATGRQP
jgi:L-asparagine permease